MQRATRGQANFGSIGLSGGVLKAINTGTVTLDPASIGANTKAGNTVTLTGVSPGDIVFLEQPAALEAGLSYTGVRVTAADQLTIYLTNHTAAPVDGASRAWDYRWFDLT